MSQSTEGLTWPDQRTGTMRVAGNHWDQVTVPALGAWTPTKTASIVIPCFDAANELPLTLAALGTQSYPADLLQIVVVDDGSSKPVEVPTGAVPSPVTVIRRERSGFGAGRARQAGLEASDGDIVLFLDADIVVDRTHVEAHARWHHQLDDAAAMGVRTFVDVTGIDAESVRTAVQQDAFEALLAGRTQQAHEWIESYLTTTDDLRRPRGDEWRIVVGASLSVRRELLGELGGLPTFGVRGTEDTVLGYRLFTRGAVLIPEREARSWHQGPRTLDDDDKKAEILRAREPVLRNEIPAPRFRTPEAGRSYRVPSLVVTVPIDASTTEDQVVSCVSSILASKLHDLVVGVTGTPGDPAYERASRWFDGDPRVTVCDEVRWSATHQFSPIRVIVPPHAVVGRRTMTRVLEALGKHELGALHVTVPGSHPKEGLLHAVTTRALRRAERVATIDEDPSVLVGELFGERWAAGGDYDLDSTERTEAEDAEEIAEGRYAGWRAQELALRLQQTEQRLNQLQRRRIVAILNALGRARSHRSPRALLATMREIARIAIRGGS